uniref:Uncharacterized protein n=1 Tax=Alectorobius mimon TaxID=360319 RepID=A0A147B6I0_9ACAR
MILKSFNMLVTAFPFGNLPCTPFAQHSIYLHIASVFSINVLLLRKQRNCDTNLRHSTPMVCIPAC